MADEKFFSRIFFFYPDLFIDTYFIFDEKFIFGTVSRYQEKNDSSLYLSTGIVQTCKLVGVFKELMEYRRRRNL